MHPLNPYASNPPDFVQLATNHPDLARFLVPCISNPSHLTIDFHVPDALRQLTIALLKKDFNLTLSLPEDRLCPTVPARLDYCLWTIDLLKTSWAADDGQWDAAGGQLLAIDIGTGASAIYALLLARLLPKAKCLATEVDPLSITSAQRNISQNNLSDTIACLPTPSSCDSILPSTSLVSLDPPRVAFTLCNPPFYSSQAEMDALSAKKLRTPHGTCTGAKTEMVTEGGEERFIAQMVVESKQIGYRNVRWFTSLCGKYSTLAPMIALYKSLGGNNYAVTEFRQGHTNRWAFGWSWQGHRASDCVYVDDKEVTRSLGEPGPRLKDSRRLVPLPNTIEYHLPQAMFAGSDASRACACVSAALDAIEGLTCSISRTVEHGEVCEWKVNVQGQSWTRSARRKRKRTCVAESTGLAMDHMDGPEKDGQKDGSTPVMDVKLTLVVSGGSGATSQMQGNSREVESGWVNEEIDIQQEKEDQETTGLENVEINDLSEKHKKSKEGQKSEGQEWKEDASGLKIRIRWVKGFDRKGFEGFWNHLLKKLRVLGEQGLDSAVVVP